MRSHLFVLALCAVPAFLSAAATTSMPSPPGSERASYDTVGCLDTLRAADSGSVVVKISVLHQERGGKLPPDFEGLFAQEFRSRFRPPHKLGLSVIEGYGACDSRQHTCSGGTPTLMTIAYAIATENGTISELGVISPSLSTELSDSVRSALLSMSAANMVPLFGSTSSLPIRVVVASEESPDSVPPVRQLFRTRLPRYAVQLRKAEMPPEGLHPKYPSIADRAGIGDTLLLYYTILADGRVAPQSVDIVRMRYKDFVKPVVDAVEGMVFQPAKLGGCPVAESVTQYFLIHSHSKGVIFFP